MKLAASIPGLDNLFNCDPLTNGSCPNPANRISGGGTTFGSPGDLISAFLNLSIEIAGVLLVAWAFWGVFQYVFAGGNKDMIAQGRKRITFSIIGFFLVALAYVFEKFFEGIIPIFTNKVTPVTTPASFYLIQPAYAAINPNADLSQEFGYGQVSSVGQAFSFLVPGAFAVSAVAVVVYFLIASFKILTSGGDKEAISSAQRMITHSIIGFVLLMMMFIIIRFITHYFGIPFSLLP